MLSAHPRKAADDREVEGPTITVARLRGGGGASFSKLIEHLAFASMSCLISESDPHSHQAMGVLSTRESTCHYICSTIMNLFQRTVE